MGNSFFNLDNKTTNMINKITPHKSIRKLSLSFHQKKKKKNKNILKLMKFNKKKLVIIAGDNENEQNYDAVSSYENYDITPTVCDDTLTYEITPSVSHSEIRQQIYRSKSSFIKPKITKKLRSKSNLL